MGQVLVEFRELGEGSHCYAGPSQSVGVERLKIREANEETRKLSVWMDNRKLGEIVERVRSYMHSLCIVMS